MRLSVGLLTAPRIAVTFVKGFAESGRRVFCAGDEATFEPTDADSLFTVHDVVIGIGFHWERKVDLTFKGALRIVRDGDNAVAINDIDVEDYLTSVIASEMSPTASDEFLKAHAVISRSWVVSQIARREEKCGESSDNGMVESQLEIIRWYDREDHLLFDLCADDHCQRYQGVTRMRDRSGRVADIIGATRGMILTDADGGVCDARFSKCCGGIMEEFSACWEDKEVGYLRPLTDTTPALEADVSGEEDARRWITSRPDAWCNCTDASVLGQVMNGFDLETTDFYRWTVRYSQSELSEIVRERSGIDFGEVTALEPLSRGRSGRITRLRVVGTKRTVVVGKELEIRRWLSRSHLYSSAFTVDVTWEDGSGEKVFTLRGAGWGHGVGLCQIGAAVMGSRGIAFDRILAHYYPGSRLTRLW